MAGKAISRRVFVGGAIAGLAGAALGRPKRAYAARVSVNDKVRLAFIGCGA